MKNKIFTVLFCLLCCSIQVSAQDTAYHITPSYFKFTTSNGLIVAVYNQQTNCIDYVYPHIFALYDSGKYVHPFAGNICLNSTEKPLTTKYLQNTHIIQAQYQKFTVNYFSSFINNNTVFYIAIRGQKNEIENVSFTAQTAAGTIVNNIQHLENPLEDLPIRITGNCISKTCMRKYNNRLYEKYFLYSFTDSLHTDTTIVEKAITQLMHAKNSLLDDELHYMRKVFLTCIIPKNLTKQEHHVVEQSISFLKMAQVSDAEIFPYSHGQIIASLHPGLWHEAWVRDGSFAIQAMTRLGLYKEAKKGLEFMLQAPSNQFKHYIYTDGKDYGPGIDYQISLTRYFGNGREECDFNEYGPNIEYDDFGLFLIAFCDYVERSHDIAFYKKWNDVITKKVANVIIHCIDKDSLIKADSGPWEHHLQLTKQYTFTSGVCARGLQKFSSLQKQYHLPSAKYNNASENIKQAILNNLLCNKKYIKGNANDTLTTDHEYYDAGVYEIFADGLITDKQLFISHNQEYDKHLRIKGARPGYIRLISNDPYENQEWVFINLRKALAHLLFNQKNDAKDLLNYVTLQASANNNTIPEMYSYINENEDKKFLLDDTWCNCIRKKSGEYIGMTPMIGYGSAAYILTLYSFYNQ